MTEPRWDRGRVAAYRDLVLVFVLVVSMVIAGIAVACGVSGLLR